VKSKRKCISPAMPKHAPTGTAPDPPPWSGNTIFGRQVYETIQEAIQDKSDPIFIVGDWKSYCEWQLHRVTEKKKGSG